MLVAEQIAAAAMKYLTIVDYRIRSAVLLVYLVQVDFDARVRCFYATTVFDPIV